MVNRRRNLLSYTRRSLLCIQRKQMHACIFGSLNHACIGQCSVDRSPFAMIASLNRSRTYLISDWTVICGGNLLNMISYLVIDNVTEDDGGLYYCNASTKLVDATISASIFLVVGMLDIHHYIYLYICT